jgi:cation transport regulator ChaB
MHSLILPDHQNQVIKKLFFSPLEGLKTCFDAFTDHQNQVLKKLFFIVWSGSKRVFMHLRILPDHQKQVLKKLFFSPLEWFKTCFDAFPDQQNQNP